MHFAGLGVSEDIPFGDDLTIISHGFYIYHVELCTASLAVRQFSSSVDW